MELKTPKRKKFAPFCDLFPFPIKSGKSYTGEFNGYNVSISDFDEMTDVYFEGNFGKGLLSKSAPNYHVAKDDMPKIVFEQQWENQSKWEKLESDDIKVQSQAKCLGYSKFQYEKANKSIADFLHSAINNTAKDSWNDLGANSKQTEIRNNLNASIQYQDILNVSKEEVEVDPLISLLTSNILNNQKPLENNRSASFLDDSMIVTRNVNSNLEDIDAEIKEHRNLIQESLKLSLEESFFLHFAIGCLNIKDSKGIQLNTNEIWQKFCNSQVDFILKYVAYHFYRAKGWTVKSGIKYGGDYLLYKKGPAHYHASYLVQVFDGKRRFSWNEFIGLNRLVETFNKELLMCYVICEENLSEEDLSTPQVLTKFSVFECISRRWIPTQERKIKD